MKLIDVAADGVARGIAEGILRSSARDPLKYPALLEPGRRYRVTVDLGHTAATILPGPCAACRSGWQFLSDVRSQPPYRRRPRWNTQTGLSPNCLSQPGRGFAFAAASFAETGARGARAPRSIRTS